MAPTIAGSCSIAVSVSRMSSRWTGSLSRFWMPGAQCSGPSIGSRSLRRSPESAISLVMSAVSWKKAVVKKAGSELGFRCCPVSRSWAIISVNPGLSMKPRKNPSKVLAYREITAAATTPPGRVTRLASARARIRSVRSVRP